ncbi:hypothetical protein [Cupriavidus sp. CuC1]|uniref:hypothetical protein n=1 Tax=Cupriavidus sp. CuC1 TaxID=3373131 RepID=UPI0037CD4D02
MGKALGAVAALLAGLGLCVPAAAQMAAAGAWDTDGVPCQEVVGQAEIRGVLQQVVGLACLQPDGTWQIVEGADRGPVTYPAPGSYYVDPWYWAPVGVGLGADFIFIDRFHHFHRMHHMFFRRSGMGDGFHGGFHGGPHRDFHDGHHDGFHDFHDRPHGGFHDGPHGGSDGGFHGGGGMHHH